MLTPNLFNAIVEDECRIGNYATIAFESDEKPKARAEHCENRVKEQFIQALRHQDLLEVDCRVKYLQNLDTLSSKMAKEIFQNVLAHGQSELETLKKDLEETPGIFRKLFDMLQQHLEFSYSTFEADNNKVVFKKSKDKVD